MHIDYDGIIYSLQSRGGISRYFTELINEMAVQPDIALSVVMHKKNLQLPEFNNLVSVEWISKMPTIFPYGIGKYITYPIDYIKSNHFFKSKKDNCDIIHSSYFTIYPNLKIPQVISVYDLAHELYGINNFKTKLFSKHKTRVINGASSIICISQNTANDLADYYSVPMEKISVVHLGLSDCFLKQWSTDDKNILLSKYKLPKSFVLYVGNRGWYKNFSTLLNAYYHWTEKEEHPLVLVGGGDLTQVERKQISDFKIDHLVIHFKNLNDQELSMFYQSADAFIFPSLYEGFGLPIIEAMASGIPVLASNIAVFREIGQDIPHYFDPSDYRAILESLYHIYYLRNDVDKLSRGKQLAKLYSWEKTAEKTLECYKHFAK